MKKSIAKLKRIASLKKLGITKDKENYSLDEIILLLRQIGYRYDDAIRALRTYQGVDVTLSIENYNSTKNALSKLRNQFEVINPFRYYGLYTYMEDEKFNSRPTSRSRYDHTFYGIKKDSAYCDLVDMHNLYHPENVFGAMNFVVDYTRGGLVREQVAKVIGFDAMPNISMAMSRAAATQVSLFDIFY